MSIYESLLKAENEGLSYALATIVDTVGCTPRSAGTKMIVWPDGSIEGTVGGGMAEKLCIEDALGCMRSGKTLLKRYSPNVLREADIEPDCVKTIDVFIEPHGTSSNLYLLGAGHVAQAVLPLAKQAGFYVTIVDTRDLSAFGDALDEADDIIHVESFSDLSAVKPSPGSFFIVCTYSHATDGEALAAVMPLQKAYVGMLGAKHKFVPIFNALREQGYTDDELKEIYAPIGLDIGGENLNEIAVSIVAEMMAVKYGRSAGFARDKKRSQMFPEG